MGNENEDGIIFLSSFKWKKACAKGDGDVEVGEQGFWDKNNKKYYHTTCYQKPEPKQVVRSQAERKTLSESVLSETSISENVAARLHKAKLILCKEFSLEESEVNPDSIVLAECMKQLYGSIWLEKDFKR